MTYCSLRLINAPREQRSFNSFPFDPAAGISKLQNVFNFQSPRSSPAAMIRRKVLVPMILSCAQLWAHTFLRYLSAYVAGVLTDSSSI